MLGLGLQLWMNLDLDGLGWTRTQHCLNQHQCAASTWMMRRQPQYNGASTPHTPATGGEERLSQFSGWGLLGSHDWQGPEEGIWPGHQGYTPTLYEKCHGIFNDHRESGRLIRKMVLFDSIMSPSLYWGIRTHTDHRVSTPAGITNTSSNSNLVFPGGLPSRQWRTGRLEHRELSRWAAVHCGPALCVIYIKKWIVVNVGLHISFHRPRRMAWAARPTSFKNSN